MSIKHALKLNTKYAASQRLWNYTYYADTACI